MREPLTVELEAALRRHAAHTGEKVLRFSNDHDCDTYRAKAGACVNLEPLIRARSWEAMRRNG